MKTTFKDQFQFDSREYPVFKTLKTLIQSGKLGQVYSVEGDYNYGRLHKILEGMAGKCSQLLHHFWRSRSPHRCFSMDF